MKFNKNKNNQLKSNENEENDFLLKIIDGGILNIHSDNDFYPGSCETCDYGSQYINDYSIELTSGTIKVKVDSMYNYALSEGYMMKTILPNVDKIKSMTEDEFVFWIEEKIDNDINQDDYTETTVDVTFIKN